MRASSLGRRSVAKRSNGEGSIYYSASRAAKKLLPWVAVAASKLLYRYGKTQNEAKRKRDEALRLRGARIGNVSARQPFSAFIEAWITSHSLRVRPRTAERDASLLRKHIVPVLGAILLHKLTPPKIQQAIDDCARMLKPATVAEIRRLVTQSLGDAVKWRLLGSNPASEVTSKKIGKRHIQILSPAEMKAFIAKIGGDRDEALMLIYVLLGPRRGEALGLQWSRIDLEARRATFTHQVQRVAPRDGGKGELQVQETLKTDASEGTVILPHVIVAALRKWRALQLEERMAAGKEWCVSDLVFTTPTGTPREPRNVYRRVKAMSGGSVHRLRHTTASNLLARGQSIRAVAGVLRNDPATVMRTYAHMVAGQLEHAADVMDEIAGEE